jgi:ankyrin repeat protein
VLALLSLGASVERVSRSGGRTALHIATQAGSVAITWALLDCGAVVNTVDASLQHVTALHLATQHRRNEVMQLLLDHGADVSAAAGSMVAARQMAAAGGQAGELALLLLVMAPQQGCRQVTRCQHVSLAHAAVHTHWHIQRRLLDPPVPAARHRVPAPQ